MSIVAAVNDRLNRIALRHLGGRVELSDPIEVQVARATRQAAARPWRVASAREAMGVPAIWSAVTLISNIIGSFSLQGYRDGERVKDVERPRVIVRPNPLTTPREFYRQTGRSLAKYGESWWWVAARDSDGMAASLVPVNPLEVGVSAIAGDWLRPEITWRGRVMPSDDMRQIVLSNDAGDLRGEGPLQACGAAVSVAVEAQEWAANFFADGGYPSLRLHYEFDLSDEEADKLRDRFVSQPPNMPRVTSGPTDVKEMGANVPAAQMLDARMWNVGESARMFQIPGSLLEYAREGATLTYQNVDGEFDKLVRTCLLPNYLEPIEQSMGDLLPRSWVSRFNVDAILRADIKTRFDVYRTAVETVDPVTGQSVMSVMEARAREGLAAGDVENAPIPQAPPQALPPAMPVLSAPRCARCSKKLAESAGPGTRILCRCGELFAA